MIYFERHLNQEDLNAIGGLQPLVINKKKDDKEDTQADAA